MLILDCLQRLKTILFPLWLCALQIETHTVGVDYGIYGRETTKSLGLHQPLDWVQVPHRDTEQYVAAYQL